ncbi:MAG: hypothetical protein IH845_00115 [Nanoarchaeota archaeon]|nr:hypothetical protein [Nanoarchaeota archaeon]
MADKKILTNKEIETRIIDLKIELLKQPLKRKSIKKEIARLITMRTMKTMRTMNDSTKLIEEKSSMEGK